jgi:alkanesulfonate monooxygenase SsuD/methylene tetrahydromethanopterin reductase-like flavin-dependent oxidoreductase (luciferase family)
LLARENRSWNPDGGPEVRIISHAPTEKGALDLLKNCGIMLEPQEGMSVPELLKIALMVESRGFGYLFRSDHLLPTSRKKDLDSPECWVTLGAIAASTTTLKFGPMVSPIGFRNPAITARMASTVDSLSPGRLQLGLGAGWYEEEYRAHGLGFPPLSVRKRQFHEALQIIRPLTRGEAVDFDGEYFSAHLRNIPKPRGDIRLIVGGRAPSVAHEAATYADEWNTGMPVPKDFDKLKKTLSSGTREVEISLMMPFMIAESESELQTKARNLMRRRGISKDEETYIKELRQAGWIIETEKSFPANVGALRDQGIAKFYFQFLDTEDVGSVELLAGTLAGL